MNIPTLYDECVKAEFELDHHESDLYIKDCQAARELLNRHNQTFTTFTSQLDNTRWLDVPFMYTPFWDNKQP